MKAVEEVAPCFASTATVRAVAQTHSGPNCSQTAVEDCGRTPATYTRAKFLSVGLKAIWLETPTSLS